MALTEKLEFLLTADPSNLVSGFQRAAQASEKSLGSVESNVSKIGASMTKIGAAGVGVGGLLTVMASGDIEAANQLKAAVAGVGQSYDEYGAKLESAAAAQAKFGHTDEEATGALSTLTTAYGDAGKAIDRMQLVEDIAAARHVSLASAADMVAKAHGGSAKVFKTFGIQVQQNADGSKNYEGALDQLAQRLNGQAAASVDSFTGHLKVLGAEVENFVSGVGQNFGPAILGISSIVTVIGPAASAASSGLAAMAASESIVAVAGTGMVAALGPFALLAGGVAVAAAALNVVWGNSETKAVDAKTAVEAYTAALQVNSTTAVTDATANLLVGDNASKSAIAVAQSFKNAGIPLRAFTDEVAVGTDNLGALSHNANVATGVIGDNETRLRAAAAGGNEFAAALMKAKDAGKLSDDQLVNILHTANDLSGNLDTAKDKTSLLGSVQDALGVSLGTTSDAASTQAATLTQLQKAAKDTADAYDKVLAAYMRLLPSELQVQAGPDRIADSQAKIADAKSKLDYTNVFGSADDKAQAQRDYNDALRAGESAVNDYANAKVDLQVTQDAAIGKQDTEAEKTYIYRSALGGIADTLNGPVHDAIVAHMGDLDAIAEKQQFLAAIMVGEALKAAAASGDRTAQNIVGGQNQRGTGDFVTGGARASGGPVWPGTWLVGERGPELLQLGGYGNVSNAEQTKQMLSGGSGTTNHYNISVVAETADEGVDRALRNAAWRAAA